MTGEARLVICAVASVVAHAAIARALEHLPPREDHVVRKIDVRIVPAPPQPPPPEPEKPPEPKPPEPEQPVERPHAQPVRAITQASVAKDAPPTDHAVVAPTTEAAPVYGVTMESTSAVGTGPAVPVGNTLVAQGSGAVAKPLAQPIAAFEATKMPLPQGRCTGKYTDDARAAGIEGTVVLDVIVGEDGRVRDVSVVSGLAHGLDEAAIAALRDCHFTPGEKDGKPVPVRVRGFKIRFVLAEAP
jgi:protein TonB